jgi:hypothetical protein
MTLPLRARLRAGSVVVVISIVPISWGLRHKGLGFGSFRRRALKGLGPGPKFGETRRNVLRQANRKALVLKGFLSFGVFRQMPK